MALSIWGLSEWKNYDKLEGNRAYCYAHECHGNSDQTLSSDALLHLRDRQRHQPRYFWSVVVVYAQQLAEISAVVPLIHHKRGLAYCRPSAASSQRAAC